VFSRHYGQGSMRRRLIAAVAGTLTLGLLAAACGSSDSGTSNGSSSSGSDKTITIGWINWDEDVAATHLWKQVLEKKGYTVNLTQLDAGPLYSGMAQGDPDLFLDGWLPITHADYWKQYKDQLEDVHVWYDHAKLTMAVPKDSPMNSIADLKGKAGRYDGKIVGIEASAGLSRVTKNDVIPGYKLSGYTLQTSSTPAMLAQLQKSLKAKQPIVVTLWRPHWAYAKFPIKDLKDPKGKLGKAEQIHAIGRQDFSKDFPQVSKWLKGFQMNDKQLGTLEDYINNKYKGNDDKAVKAWMKDNPGFVKSMTS